jgi:transglutaminase-like putative cysteine protease
MTSTTTASPEQAPTRQPLRRITGRSWVDVGVLLVLVVLGVIGFEPSFGGYSFLLAGVGGLVVGAAVGLLGYAFRLNALATVLVAILAYFLFGTALAVPGQAVLGVLPTLNSLSSLAIGAVFGWADIVTLQTPIGAPEYIAVVPYVATWLVALLSTTLATRWLGSRPRAAWRLGILLIGPVLIYLAGILMGTRVAYLAGVRGVIFAVIALIWVGWRRSGTNSIAVGAATRVRRRKIAGTAILVGAAVLVGGGASYFAAPPPSDRFVLREEIKPPFDPLQYPSPLSGFRHFTNTVTDKTMFTVDGLKPGDRIRLATLDSFTGKLWNVTGPDLATAGSGSFSLVGRTLPAPSFVDVDHKSDVTITIDDYKDVWIPSVGDPTTLDFTGGAAKSEADDLRYNAATGTGVLTSGLKKGDRYRVESEVQKTLTAADLAEVGTASVNLPPIVSSPDIVTAKAVEFAGKATAPAARLEAIARKLHDTGYLSHGRASDSVASRAGHGADRVDELLTRNQLIGDAEQYASTFALMARSMGYPARVVMGFAPDVSDGQSAVKVTGDDVTAWVEVAFAGKGWVSFDPTPDNTDIPQDQTPKPKTEPQPQVRQPPRAQKDDDKLLTPVELDDAKHKDDNLPFVLPEWVYVVALSVLIPAAIIFVPMLIVALIKRRRARRRKEAATTDARVAGAWDELLDRYSELGFAVPGKTTRIHVASSLEQQVPAEQPLQLRSLAVRTDEAVFSGRQVSEETTDAVWTEAMAAVALVSAGVTRARRILSLYRLRKGRDWASRISTSTRATTAARFPGKDNVPGTDVPVKDGVAGKERSAADGGLAGRLRFSRKDKER